MENDRHDPLPEFGPDYIDQLLSADNPVTKKEPQQPAAAEETVPAQPEAPVREPSVTPQKTSLRLALLIAVVCLLAGFLLGRLTAPKPQPDPADPTPTASTAPVVTRPPNIAVDYAAMSTKQLTDIAIEISELNSFAGVSDHLHLTDQSYKALRSKYPVLIELEQRPDAVEQLTFYNLVSSSLYGNPAATALIEYYVGYLGFDRYPFELALDCEWVLQDNELFTVYEYTKAPSFYFIMDEGGSGVTTVFNFDGCEFYLRGNMDAPADNANFWYRMELKPDGFGFASVPDPAPELTWISPSSSAWVTWQKSDQGWFIYGYTPSKADLTFTVYPSGNKQDIVLTISPVPASGEPADIAQCVLDQALTLQVLSFKNPEKDLATYPIVEAVLAQPGGISALLNLTQRNRPSMYSIVIDFRFSNTLSLLKLPAFQDRMTANEREAFQLLSGDSNVYLDLYDPLVPTVLETAEGLVLKERPDLRVVEKPGILHDIPVSEMDYWIYAPLTEAALILQQPDWDLDVTTPPGSNSVFGAWPVYNTDDQLKGWIISGKRENHYSLRLCLDQGDTELAAQYLDT